MSLSKSTQQSKGTEPTVDPATSAKLSNNLVVRIDQDSDDNLQALFDSVLNPSDSKRPLQVPFRMRKLPNSFFNPPAANSRSSTTAHSRTNSADSAYDAGSQSSVNQASVIGPSVDSQKTSSTPNSSQQTDTNRITIYHSRAHSSPASLQQTYSIHTSSISERNTSPPAESTNFVASIFNPSVNISSTINSEGERRSSGTKPNVGAPAFHMKQRSYDVISPIQLFNELGALPPGWEQARTNDGQIYYLNHLTKTTQWEDPRVQIKENQQRNFQPTVNQNEIPSLSNNLGPLPEGWEQALTESGDVYFINHVNRTTSWNDPRIPEFLQKPVKMTKPEMHWITSPELEKETGVVKHKLDQHSLNSTRGGNIHIDPFLSGDNHTRQESSDSGLSLSSNTFSLNTDFISQIDESMDCISESGLNGLDCPEHLVSSLQLEDNICNEIFDDVQNILNSPTAKQDNLEWYKIN